MRATWKRPTNDTTWHNERARLPRERRAPDAALSTAMRGNSMSKSKVVRVRPHVRRPPIGLRLLNTKTDIELLNAMYNQRLYPRSTTALVDLKHPDEIIVSYPEPLGEGAPEDMTAILRHEGLHATLGRLGEGEASMRLDSMRHSDSFGGEEKRSARRRIEESGLYVKWPQWRRR
jgi:hypothetical protein